MTNPVFIAKSIKPKEPFVKRHKNVVEISATYLLKHATYKVVCREFDSGINFAIKIKLLLVFFFNQYVRKSFSSEGNKSSRSVLPPFSAGKG
jgi:hypothetical protein